MKSFWLLPATICAMPFGVAQTAEFEVATLKPSQPDTGTMYVGMRGGPGTNDPCRFTCTNCSLMMLLTTAFNVQRFQIRGPVTLESERFEIAAKVAVGATKEQFRAMLQNLLTDRLALKLHHELREMPSYQLVIARNGPKLTESTTVAAAPAEDAPPPLGPPGPPQRDKDGYPVIPHGRGSVMAILRGRARILAEQETMSQLAARLSNFLGQPVRDATSLTGKYDFALSWSPDEDRSMVAGAPPPPANLVRDDLPSAPQEPGPTLFSALQEQLGLRLDRKRGPVDLLVIDHVEKTPLGN